MRFDFFKLLSETLQDVRFTLRQMRKSPLFASAIVLTFAIGIAANATSFSVMDAIALRPLAVPDLNRVVNIAEQQGSQYPGGISYPDYEVFRRQSRSVQDLAARIDGAATLTGGAGAERIRTTWATANSFALYRIAPMLGQVFAAESDSAGGHNDVAVLTHTFWQTHMGSRPSAVGESLLLDGVRYTVIGVMPRSFDHVAYADVWLPFSITPEQRNDRTRRGYFLTGRLVNGFTPAQSAAELETIAATLAKEFPKTNEGWHVRVRLLADIINGDLTPTFTGLILAATLLLMVVVAANISNLQFARAIRRAPEMALRCALGSSRGRVLRQLMAEMLTYSMLGVLLGLLLAHMYLKMTVSWMPPEVSRLLAGWTEIRLNGRVLAYSASVAVAAGLLAGIVPALAGMRVDLVEPLKAGGRSVAGSARAHRLRSLFAGAQTTLATVLICGAAVIATSMFGMLRAADRFDPEHALVVRASLPEAQYGTEVKRAAYAAESLRRLRALPGVTGVEWTSDLPYNNDGTWWQDMDIENNPLLPGQIRPAMRITMSPGLLATLHIPVLQGRGLLEGDTLSTLPVALISQTVVRQYFADRNPIGQHIRMGGGDQRKLATIVGVVADVTYTWADRSPSGAVYFSTAQFPLLTGRLVVRTGGDPVAIASGVRQTLTSLDRAVPLDQVETYRQFLHESLIGLSFMNRTLMIDAGIALLLCALGIFSVMANLVTERTHEIGVRFAMGADRRSVTLLMLRRGLMVGLVGLAVGSMLAYASDRMLGGLIRGVQGLELPILLGGTLAVLGITVLAAVLPARRAALVDATLALQAQ